MSFVVRCDRPPQAAPRATDAPMPASKRVRTILDSLDSALDASISHQPPSAATPHPGMRSSLVAASPISPFSMSQGGLFSGAAGRSPFAIGGSALAAPALPAAPASSLSLKDLEAMTEPEAAFGTSVTCRPHSLADLHDRLATFSNAQTWFCKPSAASPLECARAGWEIDGTDMLACRVQPPPPPRPHRPMPPRPRPLAHAPLPTPPRPRPHAHAHAHATARHPPRPLGPPALCPSITRPPLHAALRTGRPARRMMVRRGYCWCMASQPPVSSGSDWRSRCGNRRHRRSCRPCGRWTCWASATPRSPGSRTRNTYGRRRWPTSSNPNPDPDH